MKSKTLFSLIKVELYQIFTTMVASRKRSTKATTLAVTSILLPVALCIYITGMYTFALVESLKQANAVEYRYMILVLGAVLATGIVFVLTFYQASSHLFHFKDYDLLMSLPIPSQWIFMSKLLSFYLYNYFFTFFMMLAPVYGYLKLGPVSPLFFVNALLGSIALPVVPLFVSAIIAFIITFISSRFKNRNRMALLVSLVFILAVMSVSMKLNDIILTLSAQADQIMPALRKFYPPMYLYVKSMHESSLPDLILLLGLSFVLQAAFVMIFRRSFQWLNRRIRITSTSKAQRYDEKKVIRTGALHSLIKKEVSRYFNSPIYVLNTLIGPVLAIAGTIYMIVTSPQQLEVLLELPGFSQYLLPASVAMMVMVCAASSTTASSISLEGRYFWIMKSIPADVTTIFLAKVALNLLILIPALSLMSVLLAIRFGFSMLELLLLLGFVVAGGCFVSFLGLIMNLHLPKMDWVSEAAVVKQSMAVVITMFGSGGLFAGMIYLFIKFLMDYPLMIVLSIYLLILIVLCLLEWGFLETKGKKLFRAL